MKVIIVVEGGVVQSVYSDDPTCIVHLYDFDELDAVADGLEDEFKDDVKNCQEVILT